MEFFFDSCGNHARITRYTGCAPNVIIPETYEGLPVTEIGPGAFAARQVKMVQVPAALQKIGEKAFWGCSQLKQLVVDLPEKDLITVLNRMAVPDFCTDDEETSLMPPGFQYIGSQAFAGSGIKSMIFTSENLNIESEAFLCCKSLSSVAICSCDDLSIGERAFSNSGLRAFSAGATVLKKVPKGTFEFCKELEIVQVYTEILEDRSFFACEKLRKIDNPKRIQVRGEDALTGCASLVRSGHSAQNNLENWGEDSDKKELFILEMPEEVKTHQLPGRFTAEIYISGETIKLVAAQPCEPWCFMVSSQDAVRLMPLFLYLYHRNLKLELTGSMENGLYYVQHVSVGGSSKDAISTGLCTELVWRLKGEERRPDGVHHYEINTLKEVKIWLDVMGTRLPQWVIEACRKKERLFIAEKETKKTVDYALECLRFYANINWNMLLPVLPNLAQAHEMLDREFYGLEQVKERTLEIVAQLRKTGSMPQQGILLVGPPGTGKTMIAKAIAKLLALPVIRMNVPSIGEDAEILCGSSRIFENARPGRIASSLRENCSSSAVVLIDELDKEGKGNLQAILLSMLDSSGFYEEYLEQTLKTENLLCIATANSLNAISAPLKDRFDIIYVPAYKQSEKEVILRDYMLPRRLESLGFDANTLRLSEEALESVVADYTQQAGARELIKLADRLIGWYCRKSEEGSASENIEISREQLPEIFGLAPAIINTKIASPGSVNAVFLRAGEPVIVSVQATAWEGTGKFDVLGPLSELQGQYCRTAYLALCRNTRWNLRKTDISVYVDAPIPEDMENHIGAACYTAILSCLTGKLADPIGGCIMGGCDLHGNLCLDDKDLCSILHCLKCRGYSRLYGPVGLRDRISDQQLSDTGITVVEALSAETLAAVIQSAPVLPEGESLGSS